MGEVISRTLGPAVLTVMDGNSRDSVCALAVRSPMSKLVVDSSDVVLCIGSKSSKLDIDGEAKGELSAVGPVLLSGDSIEIVDVVGLSEVLPDDTLTNWPSEFLVKTFPLFLPALAAR